MNFKEQQLLKLLVLSCSHSAGEGDLLHAPERSRALTAASIPWQHPDFNRSSHRPSDKRHALNPISAKGCRPSTCTEVFFGRCFRCAASAPQHPQHHRARTPSPPPPSPGYPPQKKQVNLFRVMMLTPPAQACSGKQRGAHIYFICEASQMLIASKGERLVPWPFYHCKFRFLQDFTLLGPESLPL